VAGGLVDIEALDVGPEDGRDERAPVLAGGDGGADAGGGDVVEAGGDVERFDGAGQVGRDGEGALAGGGEEGEVGETMRSAASRPQRR